MYFESLVLEIHAGKAGWKTVKPPFFQGKSGVYQKFSFLATDGKFQYGFDFYSDVSEEEVLRTYMKRLDTEVLTFIISLRGRPRKEVAKLADDYGITILGPADIDSFFNIDRIGVISRPEQVVNIPD
ncbi:MAG: hypothetical protein OK438_00445 [Thaumarchaeota archaeon]|nr:hypothetical protein [Nitrososphaerota archaeon]